MKILFLVLLVLTICCLILRIFHGGPLVNIIVDAILVCFRSYMYTIS